MISPFDPWGTTLAPFGDETAMAPLEAVPRRRARAGLLALSPAVGMARFARPEVEWHPGDDATEALALLAAGELTDDELRAVFAAVDEEDAGRDCIRLAEGLRAARPTR